MIISQASVPEPMFRSCDPGDKKKKGDLCVTAGYLSLVFVVYWVQGICLAIHILVSL